MDWKEPKTWAEVAEDSKIYQVIGGSHAYGMNTPTSDLDTRGIFALPPRAFISLFKVKDESGGKDGDDQEDHKLYELAKFMQMVTVQNPNIIELLWTPEKFVQHKNPIMDILIARRRELLSKRACKSFSGYAQQQLTRLLGHQKWLNMQNRALEHLRALYVDKKIGLDWVKEALDEEMLARFGLTVDNRVEITLSMDSFLLQDEVGMITTHPPSLLNFVTWVNERGFNVSGGIEFFAEAFKEFSATKVNNHIYKLWYDSTGNLKRGVLAPKDTNVSYIDIELKKLEDLKPEYRGMLFLNIEAYKGFVDRRKKFQGWRKERNKTRAALEEKMGFDGKHAAHLIRLLRMGQEIIQQGEVIVTRPDAQELLSIRNGAWSLEKIIEYAQAKDKEVYELRQSSPLPDEIDRKMVDEIYQEMLQELYGFKL